MPAIWYRHGCYMAMPYGFHMDTIWPAYGLTIWNTYGLSGANHINTHMLAIWLHIWYTYGWHMTMLLGYPLVTMRCPTFTPINFPFDDLRSNLIYTHSSASPTHHPKRHANNISQFCTIHALDRDRPTQTEETVHFIVCGLPVVFRRIARPGLGA